MHHQNELPVRFVAIFIKLKPSHLVALAIEGWGTSCTMDARCELYKIGPIKAHEVYLWPIQQNGMRH